jgi:hypothetical protein
MLQRGRPYVQTPRATLRLAASGRVARSRLRRSPHTRQLLPPVTLPPVTRPICADSTPALRGSLVAWHARRSHLPPRPHPARAASTLPISRSLSHIRWQQSVSPASSLTPNVAEMPCRRRPCRWPLGARAGAPRAISGRAKGTHKHGQMLVVVARRWPPPDG